MIGGKDILLEKDKDEIMTKEQELNEYIAKIGLSVEMRNSLMSKVIAYCKEQHKTEPKQTEDKE